MVKYKSRRDLTREVHHEIIAVSRASPLSWGTATHEWNHRFQRQASGNSILVWKLELWNNGFRGRTQGEYATELAKKKRPIRVYMDGWLRHDALRPLQCSPTSLAWRPISCRRR
ncbi:hypothetical protein HAX54_052743 [Datura stramonium]|uniref:Uncharacterized protein n=1 Tax=Datura stramonium TaxID=4076 RepID=A0ABS8T0G7_DATST|nr:hypothetical protein [Datura stramonium]